MADKTYKNPLDLATAIQNADDDVLDSVYGKEGPERKLVGGIKHSNPYYGKSAAELEHEGFNGWHNVIVDKLNSSYYDTFEEFQEDLKRGWNGEPWDEKQKQYLDAYARQVFGVDPEK